MLRKRSNSPSAVLKRDVQKLVRLIVIQRDGGCLLKGFGFPCHPTLQANHLVSRSKTVGFADTRLIICLCLGHHKGYHSQQEHAYRARIRELIGPDRCALWDRAEADQKSHYMTAYDWGKEILALKAELQTLQQ